MLSHSKCQGQETLFVYFLVSTLLSLPLVFIQGDFLVVASLKFGPLVAVGFYYALRWLCIFITGRIPMRRRSIVFSCKAILGGCV